MSTLGRRPLPADEKLSEPLTILVSRAMLAQLKAEARAEGFRSLSEYVRARKLATRTTVETATAR
jgi:hypothetical protein